MKLQMTIDESEESIKLTASSVSTVDENGDVNARIKTSQNSIDLSIIDNELTTVTLTTPSSKLIYGEADGSIVITAEIANVKPFDTALTLAMTSGDGYATIDQDYSTDDDGYLSELASGFSNIRGFVEATSNDFYLAEYRKLFKLEADGTKTALGMEDMDLILLQINLLLKPSIMILDQLLLTKLVQDLLLEAPMLFT